MKHKHKIRQPKKARKVTFERIREIVRAEIQELAKPFAYELTEKQKKELEGAPMTPMSIGYEPTGTMVTIRPVPPPPMVSAKHFTHPPAISLPNAYEIEEDGA